MHRAGSMVLKTMKGLLLFSRMLMCTNTLYIDMGVGAGSSCERGAINTTLSCNGIFPATIPDGVTNVVITNYNGDGITSEMFSDKSWTAVEDFSLTSIDETKVLPRAFENLKNIKCLGLHGENMFVENDSFVGLGVLDNLDLSGCTRMTMLELLSALNGSNRIQQITTFNISQLSVLYVPIKLDSEFAEVLGPKRIISLDASFTTISDFNLTAFTESMCDNLTYLALANCRLPNTESHPFTGICPSLKRINMDSSIFVPVSPVIFPANLTIVSDLPKLNNFNFIANIDTVSFNNILTDGLQPLHNVTLRSLTKVTIKTNSFSLTNNRLQYFDLYLINVSFTLKSLDLSSNEINYLQPKFFFACTIKHFNLSHNRLNEMAENNATAFVDLFKYLNFLEHVNIASNKLSALPNFIFMFNNYLRSVDLSNNDFEQIGNWFKGNPFLVSINLRGNKVALLSSHSMTVLEQQAHIQRVFQVDLRENQIICNKCESKAFISWLIKNYLLAVTDHECLGENNHVESIDTTTVSNIEYICKRTLRIALITLASIASFVILTTVVLSVRLYRKKKHRTSTLSNILEQFREGQHHFKFVTFVAFSGEDEDFVEEFILEPLRESLSKTIGTDRELICTEDRHFIPGHSIAEQMVECCKQSGVVILVVSKSFCTDNLCGYEAQIAFTMQKPIILLFKEHVPETCMTPLLRTIFRQFVRITFIQDGKDFRMLTTWHNVCYSMFELITDQLR